MIFNIDNEHIYSLKQEFEKIKSTVEKTYGKSNRDSNLYIYAIAPGRTSGIYALPSIRDQNRVKNAIYQWTIELYKWDQEKLEDLLDPISRFVDFSRSVGNPRRENAIGINLSMIEEKELLSNLLCFIELAYIGNIRLIKQQQGRPYIINEHLRENFRDLMNRYNKL